MHGSSYTSAPSRRLRIVTGLSGIAGLTLLVACAHFEKFSNQATEFNVQVADAQNKTLLLNIVRAANRFPMHFTELSTLSGTGTTTIGGTVTIPVGILNGGMGTGSVAPTASITETPTFNVAVLETQEFYKGMLAPISTDELSTYLQEGLEPELVLSLGIGELLYQKKANDIALPILNDFHPLKEDYEPLCPAQYADSARASQYACFKSILQALLDRGLTTEPIKTATNIGGLIDQSAFNNLRWLNGLDPKVIKIAEFDLKACEKKTDLCPDGSDALGKALSDKLKNGERLYRVQKETAEYRYCFNEDPEKDDAKLWHPRTPLPERPSLAAQIEFAHIPAGLICHDRIPEDFQAADPPKPGAPKIPAPTKPKAGGKSFTFQLSADRNFTIEVQPRSTEGVIYYLGEITRCNVGLDREFSVCTPPTILVKSRPTPGEETLFAVTREEKPTSHLGAEYEDGYIRADWAHYRYGVKMDPTGHDRSGQVLRILTQLLALNRSAKDFPTPSIVPIISH
jgi:hypothetical protein